METIGIKGENGSKWVDTCVDVILCLSGGTEMPFRNGTQALNGLKYMTQDNGKYWNIEESGSKWVDTCVVIIFDDEFQNHHKVFLV